MANFFGILINLFCVLFVWMDAPKQNRNQWVWGALVLLFGLLPLGIYLVLTGRKGWGILWIIVGGLMYLAAILFIIIAMAIGVACATSASC